MLKFVRYKNKQKTRTTSNQGGSQAVLVLTFLINIGVDKVMRMFYHCITKEAITMAKEATLQVRMDSELKEQAELLYKQLGTSFAEAVRIFARQSVEERAMPFTLHLSTPESKRT